MFVIAISIQFFLQCPILLVQKSKKTTVRSTLPKQTGSTEKKSKPSDEKCLFGRRDMSHEQFARRDQTEFVGLVPGTGPTNSNKFAIECVGLVAGTKFWSMRLHFFTKMGSSPEGTWSPGLVEGTSRRD